MSTTEAESLSSRYIGDRSLCGVIGDTAAVNDDIHGGLVCPLLCVFPAVAAAASLLLLCECRVLYLAVVPAANTQHVLGLHGQPDLGGRPRRFQVRASGRGRRWRRVHERDAPHLGGST